MNRLFAQACWFVSIIVSFPAFAQAPSEQPESAADNRDEQVQPSNAGKNKLASEANINLHSTITGNQEQPQVMYILPWQSPLSPDLEMEMLSSQQDAVFGHVERDELQRSLEASGEWDDLAAE